MGSSPVAQPKSEVHVMEHCPLHKPESDILILLFKLIQHLFFINVEDDLKY